VPADGSVNVLEVAWLFVALVDRDRSLKISISSELNLSTKQL